MPTAQLEMQPLVISSYFLLFGNESGLPIDVEFDLQRNVQKMPTSTSNFIENLKRIIKYAHKKANQVAHKQQEGHKGLY